MRRTFSMALAALTLLLAGCGGTKTATTQPQNQAAPAQNQASGNQSAEKKPADFRSTDQAKKNAALMTDKSPDKLKKLADAAKANKESEITVYTSMNLEDSTPLISGFTDWLNKNYKLKAEVNLWRANSEKVLQRGIMEAQAGRFDVDVFETNSPELTTLADQTVISPFWVPAQADLPDSTRDAKGIWQADRYNFFTAAYNTKLVKPEDAPKTYEDLLDPKWKGKMAVDQNDWDWFATLVKQGPWGGEDKALDFFKKLQAQDIQQRDGHTLISELVSSGEIPLAITIYNHQGQKMMDKGAPIKWLPLEPVVARPNGIGMAANSQSPNLALLFVQYCLSEDGQNLILKQGRVPANPKANTPLNKGFKFVNEDPLIVTTESKKWEPLFHETLFKGK